MPYGYGSTNQGPPGGGATSQGSDRDYSPSPTRAPDFVTHTPSAPSQPSGPLGCEGADGV